MRLYLDLKHYPPNTPDGEIMKDWENNRDFDYMRMSYNEPKNFRIKRVKDNWKSLQYLIDY